MNEEGAIRNISTLNVRMHLCCLCVVLLCTFLFPNVSTVFVSSPNERIKDLAAEHERLHCTVSIFMCEISKAVLCLKDVSAAVLAASVAQALFSMTSSYGLIVQQ